MPKLDLRKLKMQISGLFFFFFANTNLNIGDLFQILDQENCVFSPKHCKMIFLHNSVFYLH